MPYITVNATRIFYAARGKAASRPVVFVHGAGGNHLIWGNQLAHLAAVARPIALDLPGHGNSPGPGYQSIADYAQVVAAFLKALRDKAPALPILAGHSMGGAIAQTVALTCPRLLAGLVLVGTGARLRVAPAILEGLQSDFQAAVRLIGEWAFAPQAPARAVRLSQQAMARTGPTTLYGDFLACDRFDIMNHLGEIHLPTLILCGSQDKLTPPKYSTYLGEHIAGARVQIIPEAGHMVMLERPTEVSQAISDLLATLP